jgi:predicted RNA-binding protein YlxR (DUF448 family)
VVLTTTADHRHPVRTCVGCRQRRDQADLVRIALGADGVAVADRHAPGRGAWICGPACLETAIARRAFDRAWRTRVAPAAFDALRGEAAGGSFGRTQHDMRDLKTRAKG